MHDLIIVGAGTAGCVLAERLTRSGRLRVLLVEAGGAPASPFVGIPAGFTKVFKSRHDWAFQSEPQSGAGGRRIFTPRGRMLGGSSNLNAMIHQWCHPADFDGWVAAGAEGWGWADVVPVFTAQERWLGEPQDAPRGTDGPLPASPLRDPMPLSRAFVAAARAAGLGDQPHYNGVAYEGAWLTEGAHLGGRRHSAYQGSLQPALARPNLAVRKQGQVTGIVITEGRATGVRVRTGQTEETLDAGGVVLAAGAFGSPQLLMLSGIGPAAALRSLGIAVVRDTPEVGANLQDHPTSVVTFATRGATTLRSAESPLSLLRYLLFRRGMLASNVVEAFAFARSDAALRAPDIELLFGPVEWKDEGMGRPKCDALTIAAIVAAPMSRGRLTLRSADPLAPPVIDPGLLTDPEGADARALLAAARLARKVAATRPLADFVTTELTPGASVQEDGELLAALHPAMQTVYHPTSTCRMGSDAGAVVTPRLQVPGIEGLWVADASVMPSVPRGHPNAVVAMIANRAAEFISAAVDRAPRG